MVMLVNSYEWMELSPKYKTKLQYWHKAVGWDVGVYLIIILWMVSNY